VPVVAVLSLDDVENIILLLATNFQIHPNTEKLRREDKIIYYYVVSSVRYRWHVQHYSHGDIIVLLLHTASGLII
jgi:hypothetical protein